MALCNSDTRVVPLQNGLPFWFFHDFGGPLAGSAVDAVDHSGAVRDEAARLGGSKAVAALGAEFEASGAGGAGLAIDPTLRA